MESKPQLVSDRLKKLKAFELHYLGRSYDEIASAIEAPIATVQTYFSREWKDEFELYAVEQDRLMKLAAFRDMKNQLSKATRVLVDAMDHKDVRVRIMAAKEVLDRTMGKAAIMDLKASESKIDPVRMILRHYGIWDENDQPIFEDVSNE